MSEILVLYYSLNGATESLAREICRGIDGVADMASRLRTVPPVSAVTEASTDNIPDSGPPYATAQDLTECAGLVMGSPTRFGNMDASLKYFVDSTVGEWMSAAAVGKPFGLFTSTSSLHGGQESTLLSMALPLLHHGMLYVGSHGQKRRCLRPRPVVRRTAPATSAGAATPTNCLTMKNHWRVHWARAWRRLRRSFCRSGFAQWGHTVSRDSRG